MSTRRERGFVGMNEVLTIGGVMMLFAVVLIPSYIDDVGASSADGAGVILPSAGIGFFAACFVAMAASVVLLGAILDRIPNHDPGTLGCFALWLPQVLAIGGGGLGGAEIAERAGLAASVHWFSLAGGVLGMAAYAAGVRLLLRKKP